MIRWLQFVLLVFWICACAATVPPLTLLGKWHQVKSGDTVEAVASQYHVDVKTLAELNQIPESGPINGRERIFIPLGKGKPPGDGNPPKEAPVTAAASTAPSASSPPAAPPPPLAGTSSQSKCGKEGRPCFRWPVKGKVLQWFGGGTGGSDSQSDGIDIQASTGTPVVAVAAGEVLYSGDAIKGYGNLLLVRHENSIISVYAHNARNLVKEGDNVKRGQKIAEVGDSGAASQPMLHFEVRVSEQPVDPMLYLEEMK